MFAIMMDSLTENIGKEAPWQMMFADDVVLCAREKGVLELKLEQRREALDKRGMKVSRAKTSSHVKKLEVTEMKMCRWPCGHTLRDHVRNDDIV